MAIIKSAMLADLPQKSIDIAISPYCYLTLSSTSGWNETCCPVCSSDIWQNAYLYAIDGDNLQYSFENSFRNEW